MELKDMREGLKEFIENKKFSVGFDYGTDIVKLPVIGYAVLKKDNRIRMKPLFKGYMLRTDEWEVLRILPVPTATYRVLVSVPVELLEPLSFNNIRYVYREMGEEIEGQPHKDWEKAYRFSFKFNLEQLCAPVHDKKGK